MIRINDIQQALAHLVGWEQDIIPENQVAEELTETESGLTFQGAHPMVTLENLRAVMPEIVQATITFALMSMAMPQVA